jgi:Protein of unknown function (DUF2997)
VKQLIVMVSPDGQTTVSAEGFEGNQCREATAQLRKALGQPITETLTADYFQLHSAAPQQQQTKIP